jgi:aldehyde dehydrogenase (NAD+)
MADTNNDPVSIYQTLLKSNHDRVLLSISKRKSILKRLLHSIIDNEKQIFAALENDLGRAQFETYVAEIAFVKTEINYAIKSLNTWCKRKLAKTSIAFQPGISYVKPVAKGVVLIIAPWNYPVQLSLVPLVSAIAAGNCAIVKPSEIAFEAMQVIAKIVDNLDPSCFRAICGDEKTAKALLDLSFDHIFYTGSTDVGIQVMQKAALNLTPITLELGGKSPCIIDENCDLFIATKRILWGKCLNAGQTCIAPDYLLANKKIINDFINLAKTHLKNMFGDDISNSNSYGRIVNERHFNRLVSYFKDGRIVHGGNHDLSQKFIEPTLLIDVKKNAPVMNEEVFGPILPILPIDDMDEAIEFINQKPAPLALYIFSNNKNAVRKVLDRTISGGVSINDCISHVGILELPFGGVRHSGIGNYHGRYGFDTFSHYRAVHKKINLFDNPIKYAPYSERKLKIAKILL